MTDPSPESVFARLLASAAKAGVPADVYLKEGGEAAVQALAETLQRVRYARAQKFFRVQFGTNHLPVDSAAEHGMIVPLG